MNHHRFKHSKHHSMNLTYTSTPSVLPAGGLIYILLGKIFHESTMQWRLSLVIRHLRKVYRVQQPKKRKSCSCDHGTGGKIYSDHIHQDKKTEPMHNVKPAFFLLRLQILPYGNNVLQQRTTPKGFLVDT